MYSRPDDPITRRLVFLGKGLSARFVEMLDAHDCTLPTWSVLRSTNQNPDLSQAQLAAHIGIEGPTLTRHLDRLCSEGLVTRTRDERDRRILRIRLTPEGELRWKELATLADELERRYIRLLTPKQLAALDSAICAITAAMEAADEPADANC